MHRPIQASLLVAVAAMALMPVQARAADPTTADCLAANNSSVQLRNDNKLRAARAQLLVCAANSCPADIRKECMRHVDEINAQIPTIIFEAKDSAGKDLSAVKVTVDGQPLADRLEGTAISIDPGEHSFTFETAGQSALTKPFVIREAQKDRREAITFGEVVTGDRDKDGVPDTEDACPSTPGVKTADPKTSGCPLGPDSGPGTQKILAIVAGGVGVVGLGVGSALGLMAMSKRNDATVACPNDCADQNGVNKWSDAKTAAQISDIAFVVGGVGLVGGAVLWLTAKSPSEAPMGYVRNTGPSAQVGLGPGSIQLKGVW